MRRLHGVLCLTIFMACLVGAAPALAVSGTSGSVNATAAEYPAPCTTNCGGVLPAHQSGGVKVVTENQVRVLHLGGSLPFTGLLIAPMLLIGMAALAGGLVLRRRSRPLSL
jgi:hypothetical protein